MRAVPIIISQLSARKQITKMSKIINFSLKRVLLEPRCVSSRQQIVLPPPPMYVYCASQRLHRRAKHQICGMYSRNVRLLEHTVCVCAVWCVCVCVCAVCVNKNSRAKAGPETAVNHIMHCNLYISQPLPFCPLLFQVSSPYFTALQRLMGSQDITG